MSHQHWTTSLKWKISPNQIYFLDCCKDKIAPSTFLIDIEVEKQIALSNGYITEDNNITNKAAIILEEHETYTTKTKKKVAKAILGEDFNEKVKEYREMFPAQRIPSGELARQSIRELQDKLVWFFKSYPEYDWDLVLDATEYYVETFRKKNFMYMATSSYFIKKCSVTKEVTSKLADYCQLIIDNPSLLLHN